MSEETKTLNSSAFSTANYSEHAISKQKERDLIPAGFTKIVRNERIDPEIPQYVNPRYSLDTHVNIKSEAVNVGEFHEKIYVRLGGETISFRVFCFRGQYIVNVFDTKTNSIVPVILKNRFRYSYGKKLIFVNDDTRKVNDILLGQHIFSTYQGVWDNMPEEFHNTVFAGLARWRTEDKKYFFCVGSRFLGVESTFPSTKLYKSFLQKNKLFVHGDLHRRNVKLLRNGEEGVIDLETALMFTVEPNGEFTLNTNQNLAFYLGIVRAYYSPIIYTLYFAFRKVLPQIELVFLIIDQLSRFLDLDGGYKWRGEVLIFSENYLVIIIGILSELRKSGRQFNFQVLSEMWAELRAAEPNLEKINPYSYIFVSPLDISIRATKGGVNNCCTRAALNRVGDFLDDNFENTFVPVRETTKYLSAFTGNEFIHITLRKTLEKNKENFRNILAEPCPECKGIFQEMADLTMRVVSGCGWCEDSRRENLVWAGTVSKKFRYKQQENWSLNYYGEPKYLTTEKNSWEEKPRYSDDDDDSDSDSDSDYDVNFLYDY